MDKAVDVRTAKQKMLNMLSKQEADNIKPLMDFVVQWNDMRNNVAYLLNAFKRMERFLYYETRGPNFTEEKEPYQPELFDPEDLEQDANKNAYDSLNELWEKISEISKNAKQSPDQKRRQEAAESLQSAADTLMKEMMGLLTNLSKQG